MSDIVDFSSSLTSVEELRKKLLAVGATADQLDTTLSKAGSNTSEQIRHLSTLYQTLNTSYSKVVDLTKEFNKSGLLTAPSVAGVVKEIEKLSAATSKQISTNALANTEIAQANAVLRVQTASLLDASTYTAKLERSWNSANRALYGLDNETERSLLILKEEKRAKEAAILVEEKRKTALAATLEKTNSLKTGTEKELVIAKEREKQARDEVLIQEKKYAILSKLIDEHARLTNGLDNDAISQRVANEALKRRIASEFELQELQASQTKKLKDLESGVYNQVIANKALIKTKEDLIAAEHKLNSEYELTRKQIELLSSPTGQQLLSAKKELAELRRAYRQESATSEKTVVAVTPEAAKDNASKDAANRSIRINNDLLKAEANLTHQLTAEQANLIAQTEKYKQTLDDANKELVDKARLTHGVIGMERELLELKRQAATQEAKLTAESAFRRTGEYKQLRQIQDEMLRKERIHRLSIQDSMVELSLNSQIMSSFRAGLTAVGSSIGFYSASTMAAAASTYAFTSNIKEALSEFIKFDKSISIAAATFETDKKSAEMQTLTDLVKTVGASSSLGLQGTADGLITIGQAGLDAGKALIALRPILDSATIGQISVADATNIVVSAMNQFSLGAGEARRVADYLAVASVKSSTSVANIGHALSYVGTIGSQAGFELQEAVSMIATMAQFGIDKSRAGTAGRQLFSSLVDGTTQAKEVIKKYGLELTDVEGKQVRLLDVAKKLAALPGLEKVAAVTNLVGINAASGVLSFVDNVDAYAEMIHSVEKQSKNASANMRMQFEDNLAGDIDKLKNTFTAVREEAASQYEYLLRSYAASVEKYLVSLNDPVAVISRKDGTVTPKPEPVSPANLTFKDIKATDAYDTAVADNGKLITSLDLLVAKINDVISAAQVLGIIFATKSIFSVLGAGADMVKKDFELIVDKLEAVKAKASAPSQLGLAFDGTASSVTAATASLGFWDKMVLATTTRMPFLSGALTSFSGVMRGVGAALRFASAASGYLLAAFAVYEVGSLLFSSPKIDKIVEEKDRVKELREEYEKTRKSVEAYYNTKEVGAIKNQISREQEQLTNLVKLRNDIGQPSNTDSVMASAQKAASANYDKMIRDTANTITSLIQQSDQLTAGYGKQAEKTGLLQDVMKQYDAAQKEKVAADQEAVRSLDYITREKAALEAGGVERNKAAIESLNRAYDSVVQRQSNAASALQNLTGVLTMLSAQANNAMVTVSQARAQMVINPSEYAEPPSNSKRIADIQTEINGILNTGNKSDVPDDKAVLNQGQIERLAVLRKDLVDTKSKQVLALREINNQEQTLARTGLSSAEKLNLAKKEQLSLEAEIAQIKQRNPNYKSVDSPDLDRYKELLSRLNTVKQEVSSAERAVSKPVKDPLETSLKDILSQYKQIEEKINPIHALEMKYEKTKADLERLRLHSPGLISEIELSRTLLYIKREKEVQVQQEIENAKQLYLTQNPAQKAALDLTEKYSDALGGNLDQLLLIEKAYGSHADSLSEVASELARIQDTVNKEGMTQETGDKMKKLIAGREANKAASSIVKFNEPTQVQNEVTKLSNPYLDWSKYLGEKNANELAIQQKFNADKEKEERRHKSELSALEQQNAENRFKTQEEYQARVSESVAQHKLHLDSLETVFKSQQTARNEEYLRNEQLVQMTVYGSVAGAAADIIGQFAAIGENATASQRAAFMAQKALAVAEILLYTEVAAAKVPKDAPNVFASIPLATMIRAQGYASAAFVAGMAISQAVNPPKSSTGASKGGYSGAYDNGGTIPAGSWGIVGEYAPEIVHGPAKVVSRKDTAKLLNESSGSGNYSITLAPVVNVNSSGTGSEKDGILLGNTIKAAVLKTLQDQTRPNGMLDNWVKSRR